MDKQRQERSVGNRIKVTTDIGTEEVCQVFGADPPLCDVKRC